MNNDKNPAAEKTGGQDKTDPSGTKTFVLDTNVLLHNAMALRAFSDNTVVLPMAVLEELDKFKTQSNELGRNARHVVRTLDRLRTEQTGSLGKGVPTNSGGVLRIMLDGDTRIPPGLHKTIPDDRIIGAAYTLAAAGERVIFVSKDINARVKADAIGLMVMDFEKQKVNFDELYTGWSEAVVPGDYIERFYAEDGVEPPEGFEPIPHEFLFLRDENHPKHTAIGRYIPKRNELVHLSNDRGSAWNISPRSREQRMALEILMDDSVQLVTLVGMAGTGKTLLALAAALHQVVKDNCYEKLLVTRPIMPVGKDIGYLPGDKAEKMSQWMLPIFDNLKFLLVPPSSGRRGLTGMSQEQLMKSGILELEALTYIRGRSISEEFIIVDEAQNLTPHEVKTIISRCGEGTKMVLTGDPYQIDNPYLDASSNGLSFCVEHLRGSPLTGHITLMRAERSPLSELAAEML